MMSRKDFVKVANSIKEIENPDDRRKMTDRMADVFAEDNPRFDRQRFYAYIEDNDAKMKKALQK